MDKLFGPLCHSHGIPGFGNPSSGVMIIGISPGREEMAIGSPMVGKSGKLMDNILSVCGWSREKVYATNLLCFPREKPSLSEILDCRPRLQAEVEQMKPKLAVLLGSIVTEQFFGNRKFGTVRGVLDYYKDWNCYLLPTYHPAALLHGGDGAGFIARDIVRDFYKIAEFFDYPPNPAVQFEVVTEKHVAQGILDRLVEHSGFVALDVETPMAEKEDDASDLVTAPLTCFSISTGDETWWFPGELASQLEWPEDINWTFHNGMFDTVMLRRHIGKLLPIKHDTLYMSYALDERGGVHKLKQNARETDAVGFYEEQWGGKERKWNARMAADPDGLAEYNAKDAAYTARLASRYYRKMQADDMLPVYDKLLIPAANTYRLMQEHGMYVNKQYFFELLSEWVPMLEQKETELQALVHSLGGPETININSPKQLSNFMYGTLRLPGGPSTAKEILEELAGEHAFVDKLLDCRHLHKAINTYLMGSWKAIKETQRIHPTPLLHGTVTGRLAYNNMAINTIPRPEDSNSNPYLSKLRNLFTAPPGYTLIEMDYKQAEVWMAWAYCQDPVMGQDLHAGDFHTNTAAFIHKCSLEEVTKEWRALAKKTTFGQFFLIGIVKLAKQNNISPAEALKYQTEWHRRYKTYNKYVQRMFQEAATKGELVSITGRKRRYPYVGDTSIMPQTTNWPIQSTSHDCLMSSIIEAFPVVQGMGGCILTDLHDAMLIEAPTSNWREVAQRVRDIMVKPRFDGLPSIPVEVKVGDSWGNLHEVDL